MTIKRVFVVEDDPAVRSQLQMYQEALGHRMETAGNGQEALNKLNQAGYDAGVVTD